MLVFETQLLREKFDLTDTVTKNVTHAFSNRVHVKAGKKTFSLRTRNMHTALRMAGLLYEMILDTGEEGFIPWDSFWKQVCGEFEEKYNKNNWAQFFINGISVYKAGEPHPIFLVVEKLAREYDYHSSVKHAEKAFKSKGHAIALDYEGHVGLIGDFHKTKGRIGIVLRGADKRGTFTYKIENKKGKDIDVKKCLYSAAAFLEGVQLAYFAGVGMVKIERKIVDEHSPEGQHIMDAKRRLGILNADVNTLEELYEVRYRPERPIFAELFDDAEERAKRMKFG